MMEKKLDAKEARVQIWEELLRVAKPDSKFSWQFSEFICDYEGSEKGTALLTATDIYKYARVIFITPDNNLETLREQAFRDKKTVVMTNYGITRGFFLIRPGQIPEGKEEIASLLDGVSRYWKHQTLAQLKEAVGRALPRLPPAASASARVTAISTLSTRCSRLSGCATKRPRLSAQGMMCRWWTWM